MILYFQTIDEKEQCIGLYYDSYCIFENIDFSGLTRTWKHTNTLLQYKHIEYAWLWCLGKGLEEVCPSFIRQEWQEASDRMNALLKSLKVAKVNLSENCIFQFFSPKEFSRFLEVKNKITEYVFSHYEKPPNYNHLLGVVEMLEDIKHRQININEFNLKKLSYKEKNRNFLNTLKKSRKYVSYNLFGTKTGRLTVNKGYFPILTLDKDLRQHIEPNNDLYVEIDFNGAEIRTLLALLGKDQPDVDIHEWNSKNVYRGMMTREEAKKRFFAWLYNPTSKDYLSSRFYDREHLKKGFWDGHRVVTPFFREIESDEYHCVNYTLQSTSNDVCLEQAKKVFDFLKDKKSKIAFLMHDSIIVDMEAEERQYLKPIIEIFEKTRFGDYKTSVKIGKNFGEMREINWKT